MGEAKRRRDMGLGPTGEYPEGMVRPDDKGALRFAISDPDSHGNIHIDFGAPVTWFALPRETAIDFAQMLLRKAGAKKVEINAVSKPILAIDFDGVIHGYDSGWKGAGVVPDKPVPGAGLYLLRAVQHFRVAIFSSRSRSLRGRLAMKRYIRELLWDACRADRAEAERAWAVTQGKPADYIPWTAYDVRDQADHISRAIEWPWFKPSALMTIDDRALTFNGDWSSPEYQPAAIRAFKPWNMRRPTGAAP